MNPGDQVFYDDRVRNWEEEWVSQLLEEALKLKEKFGEPRARRPAKVKSS